MTLLQKTTGRHGNGAPGFTLVEMIVSVAILCMMVLLLAQFTNEAGRIWTMGERQTQHRQGARASLDFIAREMKMATLAIDQGNSLEFVINPPGFDHQNRDAVFWQAPIATETSNGDLAEVGYFVKWDPETSRANLCRFFVNPSDTENYLIYSAPDNWLNNEAVNNVAPADRANNYQGLFLENVLGLWVSAYFSDGSAYPGSSRDTATGSAPARLPAYARISLVLLDARTAQRMKAFIPPQPDQTPEDFVKALPDDLRQGTSIVTMNVNFPNSR